MKRFSNANGRKTQLLKVSEAISTIRDATSLFSSLADIIRSIIAFDDAPMIFLLDEQRQHYRIFYSKVFDLSANLSSLGAWQQGKNLVATDPIATYLIGQNRTLVLNLKQALAQWGDFPGKQTMLDLALAECLVAPLRVNDRLSGFLCVWSRSEGKFETPKLNLFQSIADQVAVAVANILANEEILQREREKALQVAVIHALAQEGSWEEKFLRLTRVLQKYIPLDYLYLLLENDKQYGRGHAYRRIGFDEYQSIDTESFFRMTGINASKYLTMREQRVHTGPELLAGEAFEKAAGKYALLGLLARTFELESGIAIPLKLSHQGRYVLSVLSKKPHGLTPEHLVLLEKLSAPLALTLENLLAYEEIKGLKERLQVEKEYLEDEINVNYKFEDIIGASQSLKEVFKKVSQVAAADSTVLVLGETGTGKELVARAIHNLSKRSDRALVKINCAALPAQLIESELFGHEKGAFTGAVDRRIGKFELAHGSTIFLDEVGELPLELQAKLLRAIQEKEVERLGGNKIVKTDVRIIAATNRNLEKEVAQGRFRADLYFRLNVFPITLPPLRNRKEDIPCWRFISSAKWARSWAKTSPASPTRPSRRCRLTTGRATSANSSTSLNGPPLPLRASSANWACPKRIPTWWLIPWADTCSIRWPSTKGADHGNAQAQ
jgi:transcriptional regulator with GAF, ATPase, and Fis domain